MQSAEPYEDIYMARMYPERNFHTLLETYGSVVQIVVRTVLKYASSGSFYADDLILMGYGCIEQALWTYREDRPASFQTYLNLLIRRNTWNELRRYDAMDACAPHRVLFYQDEDDEKGSWEEKLYSRDPMNDPAYVFRYRQAERSLNRAMMTLSDREREIYDAVCAGERRKQTVERIGCSPKSYDGCLCRIRRKAHLAVQALPEEDASRAFYKN